MFKRLKNLFSRTDETSGKQLIPQTPAAAQPVNGLSRFPKAKPVEPVRAPEKAPVANGLSKFAEDDINISLLSVLNNLPADLKGRVGQYDVRGATLTVSLQCVMPQLAQGVVKISFGELRQAAPQLFSPGADCDQREIELPLTDILAKIPQAALAVPQKQKPVQIPEQVRGPFEEAKRSPSPVEAPAENVPAPALRTIKTPRSAPIRVPLKTATTESTSGHSSTVSATSQPPPAVPRAEAVVPKVDSFNTTQSRKPVTPPVPTAQETPYAGPFMSVALQAVCQAWPGEVRNEFGQIDLAKAEVKMPENMVQTAMKRGKVAFPWKTIRSWIVPAIASANSRSDEMVLELPLEAVLPAFLAAQKTNGHSKKLAVDESIPNLFSPTQRAEPAPIPTATDARLGKENHCESGALKPNHVNGDIPAVARKAEKEAANLVDPKAPLQPQAPNEIVSRAAALEGVAGAIVALPDGLMVASKLPHGTNGDTLAAFLPHIFSKVNECTKEIRIGELSSLDFVASNVPWKIFQSNTMFLAAFGFTGQGLPGMQLAALARQLHSEKY